jgi:hypothetical protein
VAVFFFCLLPNGLGIMRENLCRTQAVALAFECNLESAGAFSMPFGKRPGNGSHMHHHLAMFRDS